MNAKETVRLDYPTGQDERYEDAFHALKDGGFEHDAATGSCGWAGHITTTQAGWAELVWRMLLPLTSEDGDAVDRPCGLPSAVN